MCQLKAGALFKHKREIIETNKSLLGLIRDYKTFNDNVKGMVYKNVASTVLIVIGLERKYGCKRLATLIKRRAISAGLLV